MRNENDASKNKGAGSISEEQKAINEKAHVAAEQDIENDIEISAHSPNDDLDEGETARLGEKTDLI